MADTSSLIINWTDYALFVSKLNKVITALKFQRSSPYLSKFNLFPHIKSKFLQIRNLLPTSCADNRYEAEYQLCRDFFFGKYELLINRNISEQFTSDETISFIDDIVQFQQELISESSKRILKESAVKQTSSVLNAGQKRPLKEEDLTKPKKRARKHKTNDNKQIENVNRSMAKGKTKKYKLKQKKASSASESNLRHFFPQPMIASDFISDTASDFISDKTNPFIDSNVLQTNDFDKLQTKTNDQDVAKWNLLVNDNSNFDEAINAVTDGVPHNVTDCVVTTLLIQESNITNCVDDVNGDNNSSDMILMTFSDDLDNEIENVSNSNVSTYNNVSILNDVSSSSSTIIMSDVDAISTTVDAISTNTDESICDYNSFGELLSCDNESQNDKMMEEEHHDIFTVPLPKQPILPSEAEFIKSLEKLFLCTLGTEFMKLALVNVLPKQADVVVGEQNVHEENIHEQNICHEEDIQELSRNLEMNDYDSIFDFGNDYTSTVTENPDDFSWLL